MNRQDLVFKKWAFKNMLRKAETRGGEHIAENRNFQDGSLADIWGIKPVYLNKVINRRGGLT